MEKANMILRNIYDTDWI